MRISSALGLLAAAGGMFLSGQVSVTGPELRVVSEVRLVVLDVGVRDAAGRPIAGLPREAFRVFDAGRLQVLSSFGGEDATVTIGLVLDASHSMRGHRSRSVAAASALIAASRPEDELFLVTFNDEVAVSTLPVSAAELQRGIENTPHEGRTALYDALAAALVQMERGTRERKALVVISDGADTASRLGREALLSRIRSSPATVYAVGMPAETPQDKDHGFLREVARVSGGGVYLDVEPGRLDEVCREIAREIRSRYMLAFHAAPVPGRKAEWRPLRVQVSAPDRARPRVLVRRHYLALPSPGGPQP